MKEVTRVFTHGFTGAHKEHFPFSGCWAKAGDKVREGRGTVSVEKTVVMGEDPETLTLSSDGGRPWGH